MKTNRKLKAYCMLIGSMLIWGSLAVFVKPVSLLSEQIVLCRVILGLIFLLAVFFLTKKKFNKEGIRKNGIRLLITGVVMGFNWVALFESYRYTDVSVATLCYYTSPVIVFIGSVIFFKEKISAVRAAGVIAAVIGMLLVTGVASGGANPVKGVILGLISAALYATVTLSNKCVKGLSSIEITIFQLVGAAVVMLPYVIIKTGFSVPSVSVGEIMCLLILGFVHTGVALYMYFSSIQLLPAQTVALCSYVDPVSALVFAFFVFNDRLSPLQLLGVALIIGGAVLGETLHLKPKKELANIK